MKYTKLQKAGLHISKLGLGTNAVGGHNLYADVNEGRRKTINRRSYRARDYIF